jgi:hypothetical protein
VLATGVAVVDELGGLLVLAGAEDDDEEAEEGVGVEQEALNVLTVLEAGDGVAVVLTTVAVTSSVTVEAASVTLTVSVAVLVCCTVVASGAADEPPSTLTTEYEARATSALGLGAISRGSALVRVETERAIARMRRPKIMLESFQGGFGSFVLMLVRIGPDRRSKERGCCEEVAADRSEGAQECMGALNIKAMVAEAYALFGWAIAMAGKLMAGVSPLSSLRYLDAARAPGD